MLRIESGPLGIARLDAVPRVCMCNECESDNRKQSDPGWICKRCSWILIQGNLIAAYGCAARMDAFHLQLCSNRISLWYFDSKFVVHSCLFAFSILFTLRKDEYISELLIFQPFPLMFSIFGEHFHDVISISMGIAIFHSQIGHTGRCSCRFGYGSRSLRWAPLLAPLSGAVIQTTGNTFAHTHITIHRIDPANSWQTIANFPIFRNFSSRRLCSIDGDSYVHYKAMLISFSLHLILLMFELLACDRLSSNPYVISDRPYWMFVFIPLILGSVASVGACVWSVKHDRSFELELFMAVNALQFVFLPLKLDGLVNWSWEVVFVPLWIVLCLSLVGKLVPIIMPH